jgi:hypothetical protein
MLSDYYQQGKIIAYMAEEAILSHYAFSNLGLASNTAYQKTEWNVEEAVENGDVLIISYILLVPVATTRGRNAVQC